MDSKPPSRTTGPGTNLPSELRGHGIGPPGRGLRGRDVLQRLFCFAYVRRDAQLRRSIARPLFGSHLSFTVLLVALLATGCSGPDKTPAIPATAGDSLQPGAVYAADLDNDGVVESILVEGSRLTLTDGDLVYQSRDKWRIVNTSLGDVDHDGHLEVVTLVDDEEGRHIALFAYFGGQYRERIVTSEIVPSPAALAVGNAGRPGEFADRVPSDLDGDVIVLTQESTDEQGGSAPRFYRWNGFGFTEVLP